MFFDFVEHGHKNPLSRCPWLRNGVVIATHGGWRRWYSACYIFV